MPIGLWYETDDDGRTQKSFAAFHIYLDSKSVSRLSRARTQILLAKEKKGSTLQFKSMQVGIRNSTVARLQNLTEGPFGSRLQLRFRLFGTSKLA